METNKARQLPKPEGRAEEWRNCPSLRPYTKSQGVTGDHRERAGNSEERKRMPCACVKAKRESEEICPIRLHSRTHTEHQAGAACHQGGQSMERDLPEARVLMACRSLRAEPENQENPSWPPDQTLGMRHHCLPVEEGQGS